MTMSTKPWEQDPAVLAAAEKVREAELEEGRIQHEIATLQQRLHDARGRHVAARFDSAAIERAAQRRWFDSLPEVQVHIIPYGHRHPLRIALRAQDTAIGRRYWYLDGTRPIIVQDETRKQRVDIGPHRHARWVGEVEP